MKIQVSLEKVLPRIHSHLSIIGKRAVNQHGERFYEELTTSSHEDSIFGDLMCSASESIVSSISDICVYYEDSKGVTFEIINERWAKLDEKLSHDLTEALEGSIYRYIVFYCLGVFLSSIFPALSQEKFPTFGKTYLEMAESILKRIVDLSYLKRPDNFAGLTYDEMFRASSEEFEGNKIGLFTIQRNGITISSYNGTADKIADINVPVNVSELKNDSGYLDSITSKLVCDALGYTPFDEDAFTKNNIREIAEIPSWAWGAKPKYSWNEINGLDEELDKKLSISDFGKYFDVTIKDYSLGHEFSVEGSGQYISGFRLDGDKVIFQKSVFPDFSSSDVSWSDPGLDGVNLTVGNETYRLAFAGKSDGLFEKVKINDKYVIRANYPLYSVGDISAYGYSEGNMPSGGVTSFSQLDEVINGGELKEKKYWGWDNGYKWLDAPEGGGDLRIYPLRIVLGYDTNSAEMWYKYNPTEEADDLQLNAYFAPLLSYNQHVGEYTAFVAKFDSMFAIENGKIKAKMDFFSVGDISAYGDANSQIPSADVSVIPKYEDGILIATINGKEIYAPPGGGTGDLTGYAKENWVHANFFTEDELDTWIDKKGYVTDGTAQGYATQAYNDAVDYADGKFVTLNTEQEITAAKRFVSMYDFFGAQSDGIYFYNHDPNGVLIGHYGNNYYGDESYLQFRNGDWKGYVQFMNGIVGNVNVKNGGIEIFDTNPYIDFHYGNSTKDLTSRIWETASGVLELFSSSYSPGTLKIGNAYLTYDSDNNALFVKGKDGASVNLVATGDVAAYSGLGSGFDTLTDLTLTNSLTVGGATLTCLTYTRGLTYHALNVANHPLFIGTPEKELDIYQNRGYGLVAYKSSLFKGAVTFEGNTTFKNLTIGTLDINDNLRINPNQTSAGLWVGDMSAEITEITTDGTNVYITINGTQYKLANA